MMRDSDILALYKRFRASGQTADRALASARTVARFRALECGPHDAPDWETYRVRLRAEPELESYFDVFGEPDSPAERKRIVDLIERLGCWHLVSEYWDADANEWQVADSIGMIVEERPLDPVYSPYVVDLMAGALAALDRMDDPENTIARALGRMREARALLRAAGATRAADYVARAMKSVEGAARHAHGKKLRDARYFRLREEATK